MMCCWPVRLFVVGGLIFALGGSLLLSQQLSLGRYYLFAVVPLCFALTVAWCALAPVVLRHSRREHERYPS